LDAGIEMLKDPRICAASFTGSTRAGKLLARIAAERETPIPFFAEMGSLNPVVVTASAIAENARGIAQGYVAAVTGSAGQLCTKPGVLFVPRNAGFEDEVVAHARGVSEQRMLYPGLGRAYEERRIAVLESQGVVVLHRGSVRVDEDQESWVTPTLVKVTLDTLERHSDVLLEEAFGPLSIVVEFEDVAALLARASALFTGSLTGTLHAAEGEDTLDTRRVLAWLASIAGRVLFGGWPTGVAVSPAMEHGGPWPATTNAASTSVGTAAIQRFLRPVTYQDVPDALLPEVVRESNPWSVPRHSSAAGDSLTWGDRARTVASRSFGGTSNQSELNGMGSHAH
jgi:NADP-dependent aldehyde dehydrogenase